ncbi:seipin-like [Contarinia nasturtii]|uniref:seipin-like n=1 Tax=Contarinia nasturtii TaxID=265458 RepID=UPI0012D3A45E|nr:seipin-like [Contarinia nasturtii]
MGLITMILMMPFEMMRGYFVQPVLDRMQHTYDDYRNRTTQGVISASEVMIKLAILALAAAVIIWMAVFMYIAFYYTYLPIIAHTRPVHMQFKPCDEIIGPCSFPQAHVLLTKKQQLLMVGQPYRISININMPESEQNLRLGMFMVCAEMRDKGNQMRNHACRSTMLHYRSDLARTISTLVMSPLIIFGFKEEIQQIAVEVFSSYEDDQENPVTDVFVEIQSKQIQFYSVTLHITAHFSGLRYIMFHWPILSASIGIGVNLFFIMTISLLSWYHWYWTNSVWMEQTRENLRQRSEESRRKRAELISRSIEEKIFPDDEEISILEEKPIQRSIDDDSDIEEFESGWSESTEIKSIETTSN